MTPEFKKILGFREKDDDGFTYSYGGRIRKHSNKAVRSASIKKQIRNDKRSARAKDLKFEIENNDLDGD